VPKSALAKPRALFDLTAPQGTHSPPQKETRGTNVNLKAILANFTIDGGWNVLGTWAVAPLSCKGLPSLSL